MAVPTYATFFVPLLQHTANGNVHLVRDLVGTVCDDLQISAEDRSQMLQSGQPVVVNRVWWTRTYLVKAGLLTSPARGAVQITEAGQRFLRSHRGGITLTDLQGIEAFRIWQLASTGRQPAIRTNEAEAETPEDLMDKAYRDALAAVRSELLDEIQASSPGAFERLVVRLLVAMGYGGGHAGAAQVVGKSGDGGIDGLINQDPLGLDVVYIQAKRWRGSVSASEVRGFVGSLVERAASRGVFMTTSSFTSDARAYAKSVPYRLVLIDGERLCELMVAYRVGVEVMSIYSTYRIDRDFFETI